jgi:hypothetical protein
MRWLNVPETHLFMRKYYLFFLVVVICIDLFCLTQAPIPISDPGMKITGDSLFIRHQILNSSKSEHFEVRIEMTDACSHGIHEKSQSGDIGDEVAGGSRKKSIGGHDYNHACSVIPTYADGYFMAGETSSNNDEVTNYFDEWDCWETILNY